MNSEECSQHTTNSDSEEGGFKLSEKGIKMAESIGEWLLMRHFFPDIKDRKKQIMIKKLFALDMQFDLAKGHVDRATEKLRNRHTLVSFLIISKSCVYVGRNHLNL